MPSAHLPTTARENIELIVQVEQELLERRSRAERIGGQIAAFFGGFQLIIAHAVFFAVWIGLNVGVLPGLLPFDVCPFPFLGLIVGVGFIFLTTFVLVNQKNISKRQEQWSHLTLQAVLLAEREVTKNMQMLHTICQELRLGKPVADQEVKDLAQVTPIAALVEEIDKARDGGEVRCTGPFMDRFHLCLLLAHLIDTSASRSHGHRGKRPRKEPLETLRVSDHSSGHSAS